MIEHWIIWIVVGIVLIVFEMFTPSFFLLIIGIAAIFTGIIDLLFSPSTTFEIVLFSICSLVGTLGWALFIRPNLKSMVGTSQEEYVGTEGVALTDISPGNSGQVMFDQPIIGSRMWEAVSDQTIAVGEKVMLKRIIGNKVEVIPFDPDAKFFLKNPVPQEMQSLSLRFSKYVREFVRDIFNND